jgi:hypothetical protein
LWPYLVTYELADRDRHAPAISAVLIDLGAVRLTAEAWVITSDWNAGAILEQLRPIIGDEDRLLVLELGEDLAGLNIARFPSIADDFSWCPDTPESKVN